MATKTVLETLEAARKLITPPSAWTQKAFALGRDGFSTFSLDVGAVCWCARGAINRAAESTCSQASEGAASLLNNFLGGSISAFNDTKGRTHAEVLAAFDAAIAKEKEAQHA